MNAAQDSQHSTSVERVFLDWERPLLPAAAEWLVDHVASIAVSVDRIDLAGLLCIVPGRRAGRRLLLELHRRAQHLDRPLIPPTITAPGAAIDTLLADAIDDDDDRCLADTHTDELAWMKALRDTDRAVLAPLFPHPPADDDTIAWLHLARTITTLHETLAGGRLAFSDVSERAQRCERFQEGDRWIALAAVQQRYQQVLREYGRIGRHDRRERALAAWTDRPAFPRIVLIGVVELNAIQRAVLGRASESSTVTAIIHAPSDHASRFDAFGCVMPGRWDDVAVDDARVHIHYADRPLDQTQAALQALAQLDGIAADDVIIALADPSLSAPLTRAVRWAGLDLHDAAGHPLDQTTPMRLLPILADWISEPRFDHFASLVRHPDVERWLRERLGRAADQAMSQLDRYRAAHLQQHITGQWVGPPAQQRAMNSILAAVRALCASLDGQPRPASAWCDAVRAMLASIYTPSAEPQQRTLSVQRRDRAIDAIVQQLAAIERALADLQPVVDAATALRMIIAVLAGQRLPDELRRDQIEVLGWLETHADPSPAMIILGFNDGFVPSSSGADLFLPDALRQTLGLPDNHSRYARDAYYLQAAQHSRAHLTIVAGRRNAAGDPLTPSRLLLAGDDDTLTRRARRLFDEHAAATVTTPAGLALPAADPRFTVPELPDDITPPTSMSVTDFKTYLECPYRYALSRLLRVERLVDDACELDALGFGSLLHNVLHRFADDASLRSATDEPRIRTALIGLLHELAGERFGSDPPAAVRIQLALMTNRLVALAQQQAAWRAAGWEIIHTELALKDRVALDLPDGDPMPLRATIDRIDVNAATGAYRIIDYKSGDQPRSPHEAHHAGRKKLPESDDLTWSDLQLPLYEFIARTAGIVDADTVELGFVVLPKDSAKVGFIPAGWHRSHLDHALELARQIVRDIRAGKFEPNPEFLYDDDFARLCHTGSFQDVADGDAEEGDAA